MSTATDPRSSRPAGGAGATERAASPVDAEALAGELRRSNRGEVRFDPGSRALYSTDGSNYRQIPIGVVLPRDAEDVERTVAIARRFGAPITNRGGGTSLAGQCCNVAVVVDMSKYLHEVIALDPDARTARVQPGTILDDLRDRAEAHHLTFGPDPSTHNHCTLGGMIGNNSCGVHAVMAGRTSDNIRALDVLTYDGERMQVGATTEDELARIIAGGGRRGEIYRRMRDLRDRYATLIRERYPDIPRRVSGYNLDELLPEQGFNVARALVGSEGTLVTVLEATVELVHSPPVRSLVAVGFEDVYAAADAVPRVMQHEPTGLEGIDEHLVRNMRLKELHPRDVALLPAGEGWLLAEFGGETREEADERARALIADLKGDVVSTELIDDPEQEQRIWEVRKSGLGATARVPGEPDTWPGWEDSAVPPERLGDYLRDLRHMYDEYGYDAATYGHFGQGCLHTRINFDLKTAPGLAKFRSFMEHAADLVVSYGGSLSGEHGDGQSRAELLGRMFGPELLDAFREFKAIWDPDGRMNPGKVVDPARLDEHLKLGLDYRPPAWSTHFQFPDDDGSFPRATLRCVGVGECRRLGDDDPAGSTMCPSFMVTREEQHSTRGRARLLFELLRGDSVIQGWRSEPVREALDLCLACKGCKTDCPVNVDMATYKAEFLSHHYAHRLRPIAAYSLGLISWWARLAAHAPWAANVVTQTPGLRRLAKRVAGVASQRRMPRFAARTFARGFAARPSPPAADTRPKVILWPDTFNNHFFPDTLDAAVEVLEAAGYRVALPDAGLCCGRPLYDYGFLDQAKGLLRRTLESLRDDIEAGVPIVGVEPSCVAVFRDELVSLFPHDEHAHRLKAHTYILSEFLEQVVDAYDPPPLRRKALVHGHCHHKAVMGLDAERRLLDRLGLDYEVLASGCCGMAGSFGFERAKYDVSVAIGERVLLPAVRAAAEDTLIITNGFSCREQIAQLSDRRAVTIAEVLRMALAGASDARVRGTTTPAADAAGAGGGASA